MREEKRRKEERRGEERREREEKRREEKEKEQKDVTGSFLARFGPLGWVLGASWGAFGVS